MSAYFSGSRDMYDEVPISDTVETLVMEVTAHLNEDCTFNSNLLFNGETCC